MTTFEHTLEGAVEDVRAQTRQLLDTDLPDEVRALSPALQAKVVEIRDGQRAYLDMVEDMRRVYTAYAPVCATTIAYHLTLCGWRRTGIAYPLSVKQLSGGVEDAQALLAGDLVDIPDSRHTVLDLRSAPALRDAVARHFALCGYRLDPSKRLVKKRFMSAIGAVGVWDDACVWVPADAPDRAADDLQPGDTEDSRDRPADVRTLAARRDGVAPQSPQPWTIGGPKVNFIDEERPDAE